MLGPILAAVTTLVATNKISLGATAVTASYAMGAGLPMLLIAYGGRRVISRTRSINRHTATLQRAFGVIMVAFALTFFAGVDRTVQAALVQSVPVEWTNALTGLEDQGGVRSALDDLSGRQPQPGSAAAQPAANTATPSPEQAATSLPDLGPAPEFQGISDWINGGPVTLESLKGKVVLVDFWTYSCINCIRTLPYLNDWNQRYADSGLVIVGVHTPEFEFEKSTENVAQAVHQYGIKYLVAQDNQYATWMAYDNIYWPAKYIVDANGRVRYTHFGEGKYEETENVIRSLLEEAGAASSTSPSEMPEYALSDGRTPEIYLGAARQAILASPQLLFPGQTQAFSAPDQLRQNQFAFGGEWQVDEEYALAGPDARLDLRFMADKVYLVLAPEGDGEKVNVLLDGQVIDSSLAGSDVQDGSVSVNEARLYQLVDLHGSPGAHQLSLRFTTGGTRAYAFTFG